MLRIVRVRAGRRQCEPSLACVHGARGFSWVVSQLRKRKVFIHPAGASSNLPLSSLLLSSSQCFPFSRGLIDTPLMERHMSLSALCGYESS